MRRKSMLLFPGLIWSMAMLILLSGCATTQTRSEEGRSTIPLGYRYVRGHVPSMEVRQNLGTLTIIPAQYPPQSNFYTFASGALAGAQKNAIEGGTAAAGVSGAALGITAAAMPAAFAFAAPVAIVMMTVAAATATTAVTVDGALNGAGGISDEQREQMRAIIADAVARLDAQHVLAKRMESYVRTNEWVRMEATDAVGPKSPDDLPIYSSLQNENIGTVLEVSITEIGFDGCGEGFSDHCSDGSTEQAIFLFMVGQVRLVRVKDGVKVYLDWFRYDSPPRALKEWAASDAELFSEELERGYRDIAERVSDELFLESPLKLPGSTIFVAPNDPTHGRCWLLPLYPEPEFSIASMDSWIEDIKEKPRHLFKRRETSPLMYTAVDSRSPTLRWSPFPRELDKEKLDPAVLKGISGVTYDLKIWEAVRGSRGKVVYERTGLSEPRHTLEIALDPGSRYFWSVRARFWYEGQPMSTHWAFYGRYNCTSGIILNDMQYYRFVTPN